MTLKSEQTWHFFLCLMQNSLALRVWMVRKKKKIKSCFNRWCGYDDQHSGVAPVSAINDNGRVNHIGEQVLYLAEDIKTSCKEQKATENDYISVAECTIKNKIKLMDFTLMVSDGLDRLFSDETVQFFASHYSVDIRAFYIFIKDYLTSPAYAEQNYAVPLDFLDILKNRKDISGIKYNSSYTDKYNIALWDENKNNKCTNGKVMKGIW